jgi:hypothetical protein
VTEKRNASEADTPVVRSPAILYGFGRGWEVPAAGIIGDPGTPRAGIYLVGDGRLAYDTGAGGTLMPLTDKDRQRQRRQRRQVKLRALKQQLAQTTDSRVRKRLITKIQKLHPWAEVPDR